jgi:hypothetical protein
MIGLSVLDPVDATDAAKTVPPCTVVSGRLSDPAWFTTRWKHVTTLRDGQFSDEFTQVVVDFHHIERTGWKETGTFRPAGAERNYWPTTLPCGTGNVVYQKPGLSHFPQA